jgi:Protein of unknown function (DUF2752)
MPTLPRLALVASVCAAALVVASFDPATTGWMPSCPLYSLTGLLCPLCGSLRAVHALLTGAPVAAFEFNPLLLVTGGAWAIWRRQTLAFCLSTRGLAAISAFALLRNLWWPAGWLGR